MTTTNKKGETIMATEKNTAASTTCTNDTKEDIAMKKSIFETLNAINVNEHTEKKNGLTYLSWAWAWAEVKKLYPDANYNVFERNTEYGPVNYFTDGKTCWVKTCVFIEGLQHIDMLPVMDFKNRSIPLDQITSTDVNKAIQRSLTKAIARHGLGLYIYAGEDLPEEEREASEKQRDKQAEEPKQPSRTAQVKSLCAEIGITLEQFGLFRNAAAQNSLIADVRISELSAKDFDTLMNFVKLNAAQSA